jgi:hypothetical protein
MHPLGVGAAHKGQAVTILIEADTVSVIHRDTGQVSATTPSTPTAATCATNTDNPADGHTQYER